MRRMKWFAAALMLFAAVTARADMPPEPGYSRVSVNFVLEVKDDIADYRFFLKSGNSFKEIFVKKGERTSVGAIGGGALYSRGTLVAVPTSSLKEFSKDGPVEQAEDVKKAYFDGKLKGVVDLIEHGFTAEVKAGQEKTVVDPVYNLERKDGGITATRIASEPVSSLPTKQQAPPFGVSNNITTQGWFVIIAGCLGTFALIGLGVWMFRRSRSPF